MPEEGPPAAVHPFSGRTAWARNLQTPLQVFLRTEAGSAAVLLCTAVAALAWVNISASSYDAVWGARLSVLLAGAGVSLDLREWVNSGLMTFFFFIVGGILGIIYLAAIRPKVREQMVPAESMAPPPPGWWRAACAAGRRGRRPAAP